MKLLKVILPLSFLIFSFSAVCSAEYTPVNNKKYSILGENKDEIFSTFDEYEQFNTPLNEQSSSTVISKVSDSYEVYNPLPPTAQEVAGEDILNFLNESVLSKSGFTKEKWQKLDETAVETDSAAAKTQIDGDILPPGIKTVLPFESHLSLSGRKLIGVDYTTRIYDKPEDGKRKDTSSFKMNQELQMKINGSVGDRLNINVDYDDTTDKKDISLVYKGKPEEFIQEAAFGDISVSLPSTEFVGYSKELFGLKIDTKYKTLSSNAFFSKTKGASEMKRYTGNTQLERKTIPDTSYIRLKYYSIKKPGISKTIKPGTAKVFLDYQKLDPGLNTVTFSTITTMLPSTHTYTNGRFVLLVAGQDYTIDYTKGIITFKNTLANNYVAAIDYQYTDDTWLSDSNPPGVEFGAPQMIKDVNNTVYSAELKTFYNLGNLKIIRDNGRGNFILEIKDLNGDIPQQIEGGKIVPKYPSNINVDFENGVFNLNPVDGMPLHDPLYNLNTHLYNFIAEYQYVVKILMLRPGIVPQSEKVVIDGIVLKANTDYIIDYDLGILTIQNESLIKENSTIDISYDYSMFGGESESTLIGLRSKLDLTNKISMGASFLYNFTAKGLVMPDIRSTPTGLMVGEADFKVTSLDINTLNMRIDADAEYAVSSQDDNTSGKAVIDSMDSSVYEDNASMLDENWFHSSSGKPTVRRDLRDLSWKSYDILLRDIDPDIEVMDGQKQLVLEIDYNVMSRSQVAFSQKLSTAGYDFTKKLYVDIWIKDNGSTADFAIEYAASINEDADGNLKLDTEDKDANGIISPWEDTGQEYRNTDDSLSLIGAHNGKLDSEDLNGNGVLDTYEDIAGSYQLSAGTVIKNHNGWKQIRIPLNIDTMNTEIWKNVRIVRFKVLQNFGESGKIIIGKISICGNKWEKASVGTGIKVESIGRSDPEYAQNSIIYNTYYQDLYDIDSSSKKEEQSLQIEYNTAAAGEEALAKSVYMGESLDISKYDSLRFFVFAKNAASGDTIIFRAGGNDTNYFEYKIQVTDDPSWKKWKLITIEQPGHGRAAKWSSSDPNAVISSSGMPSLEKISQITVGVISSDPGVAHKIWFNEIHVTGSKKLIGEAWRARGSLQWKGSGNIGAITAGVYKKSINRNFQTITAGVYNRDYSEDSAYLNFDGVKTRAFTLLPLKTGLSKITTITPDVADNSSNLISINEEGKVVTYTGYAETNLNFGADFPQVSAQYSRSIIDTSDIERLEDKESLSGNLVYNNPIVFPLLPTTVNANARTTNSYYKVYPSTPIENSNSFLGLDSLQQYMDILDYHTLEKSDMFSIKLPFKFSKGILFSPSYIVDKVKEKNRDFPSEIDYDKSLNQTIGATLVLGFASWFTPTFTYSINTRENYNVIADTNTLPGEKKYIERSGVGEISWNLNAYDIKASPFLKSLTFSAYYRLQDSDSYDNVDKDFESTGIATDKLWIRKNPLMDTLPSYSSSSYTVRSLLNRDDIRIMGRYMPFEAVQLKGFLSPLKTLSANFTYTEGKENSYVTGTVKDVFTRIWPELLIGISKLESFVGNIKWMTDTQMNFKYQDKSITTYGVSYAKNTLMGIDYRCKIKKKLDLYFSYENTDISEDDYATNAAISDGLSRRIAGQGAFDIGKWRFSLRYENEDNWRTNAEGKYASQVKKNSYLAQINSDLIFPLGIKIPLIKKVIPLKNRIIFISNIKYITQESEVNVEQDNTVNTGISANADYEVSKYLRVIIGASYDRVEYTYNSDLNYMDLAVTGKLTVQF